MPVSSDEIAQEVVAYYRHVADNYNRYAEGTYGWHYGLWDPRTESHAQALLNSNRRLVLGSGIGPGSRVLDIGCGVGGFATWAAATLGCHVEGITLVPDHVRAASELAAERGVDHLCTFRVMDMNELAFASRRFDLVTSQESFEYAADKPAFMRAVTRALVPGGCWNVITMSVRSGALSGAEQAQHREACEAWAMAPLSPADQIERLAPEAGFASFRVEDVTDLTLPSARRILEYCERAEGHLSTVSSAKLERFEELRALRRHVDGGRLYSGGLEQGLFRHYCYYARTPQYAS